MITQPTRLPLQATGVAGDDLRFSRQKKLAQRVEDNAFHLCADEPKVDRLLRKTMAKQIAEAANIRRVRRRRMLMEPGRPRPAKQPDQTIYEMSWPSCVVAGIVDPGSSHVAMGTTIALSAAAHWLAWTHEARGLNAVDAVQRL